MSDTTIDTEELAYLRDLADCAASSYQCIEDCPGGRPIVSGQICVHCDHDMGDDVCGQPKRPTSVTVEDLIEHGRQKHAEEDAEAETPAEYLERPLEPIVMAARDIVLASKGIIFSDHAQAESDGKAEEAAQAAGRLIESVAAKVAKLQEITDRQGDAIDNQGEKLVKLEIGADRQEGRIGWVEMRLLNALDEHPTLGHRLKSIEDQLEGISGSPQEPRR